MNECKKYKRLLRLNERYQIYLKRSKFKEKHCLERIQSLQIMNDLKTVPCLKFYRKSAGRDYQHFRVIRALLSGINLIEKARD